MIENNTNPWFVKELETGFIVIGDHQHFKGYTLFLCKEHKTELFQLDHTVKMKFLEEMSVVAEAVANAFNAEKMNYELLGNGNLPYIIQNSIMGLVSVLLAFGVSRICMSLMNGYVESMGVVLNMSKVYPMEFIILLAVFIISVLPTVIWTFCMSRKDSIAD